MISTMKIKQAIEKHLPNVNVEKVIFRGEKVRSIFEVILNNNTVFLKLVTHPEWIDVEHEFNVVELMLQNKLPAPKILAVDKSCEILDYPFIIQEQIKGEKLARLLIDSDMSERVGIYRAIGDFYKKMHSIKGKVSGLWSSEDPYKVKYSVKPAEYMFKTEIVNGSGKKALQKGFIDKPLYNSIIDIWSKNLNFLHNHEPVMVHVSPFLWNIYLCKKSKWQVSKIMSMGDVMWWDKDYDLATLKYPPFGEFNEQCWQSFIESYGTEPNNKRLLLYRILHLLCACIGVYMEPSKYSKTSLQENLQIELTKIISQI